MAAKLNKRTATQTRDHIQTVLLVKRLQDHVVKGLELKATQIDAAKFLINQALGTARQSVQHTGDEGGPVKFIFEDQFVRADSNGKDSVPGEAPVSH